jgi:hypothetical protein
VLDLSVEAVGRDCPPVLLYFLVVGVLTSVCVNLPLSTLQESAR